MNLTINGEARSFDQALTCRQLLENLELAGKRVAVTRATDQASELGGLLAARGAEVVELPLIRVSAAIEKEMLADVLLELGGYDWIVFTSANGVRHFFAEFNRIFDDIGDDDLSSLSGEAFCADETETAAYCRLRMQPLNAVLTAIVPCRPITHCGRPLSKRMRNWLLLSNS